MKYVLFRGVNCSDVVGYEINYSYIMVLLLFKFLMGRIWDREILLFWFNFVNNVSI